MSYLLKYFEFGVAAVGTFFTYLWGGWDIALITLVVFLVVDYLTGVLCAALNKALSSEIGFRGLAKKLGILMILIVAAFLDKLMGSEQWLCRTAVCYFYVANEGISILENTACLGIPVPKKITELLQQLSDKSH